MSNDNCIIHKDSLKYDLISIESVSAINTIFCLYNKIYHIFIE